jgi:D-hexose-6-phosphate mutarotase
VQLGPGRNGLTVARVTGRAGSAEVYLQGAHVAAWAPAGQASALWMSAASRFAPHEPLRGGVPICFPWFGAQAADPEAPAHGFARLAEWEVADAHEEGDDVVLAFRLADTAASRASAWPHRFDATYTVTVGARLTLALRVTNRDPGAVTFEEALHTYLRVQDIRATTVSGLQGAPFLDRVAGPTTLVREAGPVRFAAETDRMYLGTHAATTVLDGAAGRSIAIGKQGSSSTVVWNPWAAKAGALADFGDDEWTAMVCVETCNVRADAVRLAPGESHTMTAVLEVAS